MVALIQIASHIPAWVGAVLIYGIVMGIRSMFARNVSLAAMSVVPLLFLGLSLTSLLGAIHSVVLSAPVWAGGIVVGLLLGLTVFSARILEAKTGAGRLRIAGSPITLILFVLIFVTKFYYNMHIAMDPVAAQDVAFVSVVLGLSGMSTGIVFGRVAKLFAGYFGRGTYAAAD